MRKLSGLALALALSACGATLPDSGADGSTAALRQAQRDAALAAQNGTAQPAADPAAPVSLSDEQDFSAVSSRETIESDAERIARNRAAYQEVAPTALPDRPADDESLIVEFALSTTNSVGQPLYSRFMLFADSRFARNCAKYPSPDKAQEDFLKSGGPRRDPKGLDPDGDGFACYWDPAPFRLAKLGPAPAPVAQEIIPKG
jgi:hypothetical protein